MTEQSHHDHHEAPGGVGVFVGVFIALCLLTCCSFLTYSPLWRESVPVGVSRAFMMAVSCTKAMLVIMFFMHLKWEANWKWVLTVPASVMSAILILALVPDVGMRMDYASYQRMIYAADRPAEEQPSADDDQHEGHPAAHHAPADDAARPAA